MGLTDVAVRRPVTIVVIAMLLAGLAIFMVPNLAVAQFPSTDMPVMMISTTYTGASPEEVEDSVTSLLEKQLSNVSGLESITSTSSEGRSRIRLEFDYSIDLDEATSDIRDSLERVTSALPDEASSPQILKFDSSSQSIMRLVVTGNESSDTLTRLAEDLVQPKLERIEGVASADVTGGETKEVKVQISLNRLEAFGLTMSSISSALAKENALLSAGNIEKNNVEYSLRINEQFSSLEDIKRTVIAKLTTASSTTSVNRSNVVRLEDVADVFLGTEDSSSRVYINGTPSITLQIMNESDTNTVQVAEAVKAIVPEINKELPVGITLDVLYDQTTMISSILKQVYSSAFQGAILAMIILLFFLRNIRSTIIIGITIPVSILITLGAMYFFDLTLNMISLTGLILGLGMIVDNSIVILENIFKYRERGAKLNTAALLGSREMVTAITASTLTTLCVFIPMIIWKDDMEMLGQMFQDMIFTIVISLITSLLVALTLVPTLASHYLKISSRRQKPIKNPILIKIDSIIEGFLSGIDKGYAKGLNFALKNRFLIITLVAVMFVASVAKFSTMGLSFQPGSNSDDSVTVSLTMPVGTALDHTEAVLLDMKEIIETEIKGYKNLIVTAGSGGFGSTSTYKGSIEITLPDLENQIDDPTIIKKKLKPFLTEFPNATFEFSSGRRFGGTSDPVDIEIISSDLTLAGNAAAEIRDLILNIPQVVEPVSSLENGAPEYQIVIDKDRAASLGLTMTEVATAVNYYVDGITPVTYWYNGEELNVTLQLKEEDRDSLPDLQSLFLITDSGSQVALSNLASFQLTVGPEDIDREDEKRVIHVTADITDGSTATEVMAIVKSYVENNYVVPDGIEVSFGGEAREISRIGGIMIIVIVAAIILVFAVMASLFESFVDPLIILFSIPLLLIGVVAVYTLLGQSLSLFSVVGMVVLVGIVVNNGIVLVDYTNLLRHKGAEIMDACKEAAKSRLRPVLMTSLTTILGMVPMGFFAAEGTESIQSIGQTVVGGLVASTLLTLFITPVLYTVFNKDKKIFKNKQKLVENMNKIQGVIA